MKLRESITSHPRSSLLAAVAPLLFVLLCSALPQASFSAEQTTSANASMAPTAEDLRPDIKQPYIVQKGDTLWDIANHFFKNPYKWLKIWERNLYITNPDLIYPGNEIWFAPKAVKSGGLIVERTQPTIHVKPVEHFEDAVDTSKVIAALQRQDFIRPEAMDAAGYVLDSRDDRINYGANDRIYLKFAMPVEEGEVFDVFRSADPVIDPATEEAAGMLVMHLGKVRIGKRSGDITEGLVIRAFEEISRGDRLKPARSINTRIQPDYPAKSIAGAIMYIRNNAAEAGQYQIVGINVGEQDGVKTGSVLNVLKAGRTVDDNVAGGEAVLPEENIGQLIVLAPQAHASIALVTRSTFPINRGDAVRNAERP